MESILNSSASPALFTVDQGVRSDITTVHPDIIRSHILTRLDGQSLLSASCASPHLRFLSDDDMLWTDICNSTWPSTADPLVRRVISSFPSGHRSFFSDSFPSSPHHLKPTNSDPRPRLGTSELISAVDVRYDNELVYSKSISTETLSWWFRCSPFRIDLIDMKETVPTSVKFEADDDGHQKSVLEKAKSMSLSWILIDSNRRRAVNLSSPRPVTVQRHWLTGHIVVRYATIIAGERLAESPEMVQCKLEIICGGEVGGKLNIKEVGMQVEDMDGRVLNGKESLVIFQEAMDGGRSRRKSGEDEKRKYEEYEAMKRERGERKQRRENRQDMICIAVGIATFMAFLAFILSKILFFF